MTELLVGTKKGLVVLRGGAGRSARDGRPRLPGRGGGVRHARPQERALFRRPSRTASSARICSTPTTRPGNGSRPRARPSRLPPTRPSSGSGWSSRASATACCGAAWRRRRCSAAATAARAGRWWRASGTCPSGRKWEPGAGGLCLHSICPWPGDPNRLAIGISSAGVWLTDDARQKLAAQRRRPGAALHPGGGAQGHARLLRPQHAACAAPAGDALHAVPRRRLPLRRRRRKLDRHRHRSRAALRFRLPARHRPQRSRPRVRRAAGGGHGPGDARRQGARVRDARPRRRAGARSRRACRSRRPISPCCARPSAPTGQAARALFRGAESGEVFGSADGGRTWSTVATPPAARNLGAMRVRAGEGAEGARGGQPLACTSTILSSRRGEGSDPLSHRRAS